ncbi:MAG: S9 family peptidase [Erythrobacter sp.]
MHRLTVRAALIAATALALTAPLAAQDTATPPPGVTTPPMSAQDLVTLPRLGAPAVNAAGTLAVYTVTTTDPQSLKRTPTPYLLDLATAGAKPVEIKLALKGSDFAFGADGALYFLSSESTQKDAAARARVWRVTLAPDGTAGTPQLVTAATERDIAGFKLAPNGKAIAVWGEVPRDCPTFGCADAKPAYLPGPGTGRLYEGGEGFVRHWDRWATPGLHNRIFVFPLAGGVAQGQGVSADGTDPANGITADTPTMPFGGGEELAFAPDASALYFTARLADGREPLSTNLDIYRSKLDGAAPDLLTARNEATDTQPAVSPDGKHLAWLAMDRPTYEADRLSVRLMDLKTGTIRNLTEKVDLSFGSLAWAPDGRSLIAMAEKVLDVPAFRIDVATGKVSELNLMAGNEAHIANVVPLPKGGVLFTRDSLGAPAELFLSNDMGQARPLTDVATTRMGRLANIVTRRFSFVGAHGDTVWGQITRLADQTGPIPAILFIHGGPQGSFNDSWSNRWNPRVVASQGYAVISVDFHGST